MHTQKFDHITPVLEELHWLPVRYHIMYKIVLLVLKSLNGEHRSILPTCCTTNTVTYVEVIIAATLFPRVALKLWNTLPAELILSDSGDILKKRLKTYLFKMALIILTCKYIFNV